MSRKSTALQRRVVVRWVLSEKPIATPTLSRAQQVESLHIALPHAAQCLKANRADLVASELIDDFVSLDWLEWRGGHLQLTVVGQNLCRQLALARAPQPGG